MSFVKRLVQLDVDSTFIQQKIDQVLKDLNIEHIRKNLVGKSADK